MSGLSLHTLLSDELGRRGAAHLLRERRVVEVVDAVHIEWEGRRYVNFASNNYLGLTHHPRMIEAARRAMEQGGAGAGASALVSGYSREHAQAESAIAEWKGVEAAALLPSGYQSAAAAIQTLAGLKSATPAGVRILMDKLAHASLVDAVLASGLSLRVFPHNSMQKLRRLLADAPSDQLQVVVTESIFSMDGDACDLHALADLKRQRPFVLLLDEAHGSGVYGEGGAGYASECGLAGLADVTIVTLSKAMGAAGGAVCGSRPFIDAMANWGRAYIYSTAVTPATAAAAAAAIQVMRHEPWRQTRVRAMARRMRQALTTNGVAVSDGDSPIIPIVFGAERLALAAGERLRERGLFAVAIRPPTVARGTSRLRITLSCEHSDQEVEHLVDALREIWLAVR